ncbi:MAG TPA: type II secretion system F family protein [Actinomycetota bacterium]|nr:type II secretion system F family protein [Actinomycetota bacterium]
MTALLVSVAGALGVALLVTGLPLLSRVRLEDRVEPYLGGLHGRPSALRARSRSRHPAIVRRLAALFPPREDLAARLVAAGDPRTPEAFRVEQTVWALVGVAGSIAAVAAAAGLGTRIDPAAAPALALLAGVTGWTGRDWILARRTARRRGALTDELPAAIDLLVLALMAGESVPAALARVSALIRGPLASEIDAVLGDVRAGAPVVEALEGLARRVDDPSVARFVDALCTGIEKGAPLADVLRAQADDGREQRRRGLLEAGGRREVWMLVPVVFLIMPVVVVWALFPGLVSLDLLVP